MTFIRITGRKESSFFVILIASFLIHLHLGTHAIADYAWPLEKNFGISATFGEYRADHFHAGLDLSTNGETGLPVLAVADGMIHRMKVQKRGYGRALYIQHPDGMESVYAHLDSFSTAFGVEQIYQQKVTEMKTRFVGDVFLEPPVPVKKGEVIAYSGETGAGLPHLHLELRRNETIAVNPLLNGFQDPLDPVPPTFQACYFYPLTHESAVNGDLETQIIRLKKKDLYFEPEQTPVVRGDFIASVSVYDAALRPYHRAPRRITMSIDNRVLYALDFSEYSYSEPPAFGLVYDLGKPGPSYYEHPIVMTKLNSDPLPFVTQWLPFSTKGLAPGLHQLQIEASDANNNSSLAHIDFIVNEPPKIEIENMGTVDQDFVVAVRISDRDWQNAGIGSLAGEVEYSTDDGKTFLPFPVTILNMEPSRHARFTFRVPLAQLQNRKRVLIKARGFDGVDYSGYAVVALQTKPALQAETPKKLPDGKLRITPYPNSVKVTFDTEELVTYPLQIQVGTTPTVYPLKSRDLTSYEAIIPAPQISGSVSLLTPDNRQIEIPVQYVQAGTSSLISGENYDLQIHPDSLYWSTFVWPTSLPVYGARYLPLIGPMLQIGPRGVPLKKETTLSFRYPGDLDRPERLSIYAWDRTRQKWSSLVSSVDTSRNAVSASIKVFDLYALIYDNVAPIITPISPKKRSTTSNPTPKLAAGIRDSGMEVDDEKVTFYVDGVAYAADYDPDRNVAIAKIEQPLRSGYHKFWVVAYDYAGNKTESPKISFRVR